MGDYWGYGWGSVFSPFLRIFISRFPLFNGNKIYLNFIFNLNYKQKSNDQANVPQNVNNLPETQNSMVDITEI